jgi:hypothetical protein
MKIEDIIKNHKIPGTEGWQTRQHIALEVQETTGVNIHPRDIEYQNGHLILKVTPVIKSALLLQKKAFINRLSEQKIKITEIH